MATLIGMPRWLGTVGWILVVGGTVGLTTSLAPMASGPRAAVAQEPDAVSEGENKVAEPQKLRHLVLLQFKESSTPEEVARLVAAFRDLPRQIPAIAEFEFGLNNSPEGLDQGFTHCFLITFGSEKDREVYLPHPAHRAFVDQLLPHLEKVLVVDYWAGR